MGAGDHHVSLSAGSYAQLRAVPSMQGDQQRTVELWLRTTQPGDQCLLGAGSSSHVSAFSLCLTGGHQASAPPPNAPGVYLQTFDGDIYIPNLGLNDGSWHYLAATLSGANVSIVVDGQTPPGFIWNGTSYSGIVAQPFALPSPPQTSATPVTIGAGAWAPSSPVIWQKSRSIRAPSTSARSTPTRPVRRFLRCRYRSSRARRPPAPPGPRPLRRRCRRRPPCRPDSRCRAERQSTAAAPPAPVDILSWPRAPTPARRPSRKTAALR